MKPASLSLVLLYVSATVVSILVGSGMSGFYDWTGADQSRPAPIVGYIGIGLLAATLLGWSALFISWLLRGWNTSEVELAPEATELPATLPVKKSRAARSTGSRLSILSLLVLTTAVATLVCGVRSAPWTVSVLILLTSCGWAGWTIFALPQHRLPLMAIFACMWCPYLWLVASSPVKIAGIYQVAAFIVTVPAFLPSLLIGRLLGARAIDEYWVGCVCTGVSILFAVWAARNSARWALAYLLLTLFLSMCGSFCLHALLRA